MPLGIGYPTSLGGLASQLGTGGGMAGLSQRAFGGTIGAGRSGRLGTSLQALEGDVWDHIIGAPMSGRGGMLLGPQGPRRSGLPISALEQQLTARGVAGGLMQNPYAEFDLSRSLLPALQPQAPPPLSRRQQRINLRRRKIRERLGK